MFLPECEFRGRQNAKIQFTILAAASHRGGVEPDLLGEASWWQADDFWHYVLCAAVALIRACAERAGVSAAAFAERLALGQGIPLERDPAARE